MNCHFKKFGNAAQTVVLLTTLFMLHGSESFGQEPAPDGTEGEVFETPKVDSISGKKKIGNWRLFDNGFTTLKLGGGFLYEFAGYSQDATAKRQMDSIGSPLSSTFAVRDVRVVVSGQIIKSRRPISWKFGAMYDGPTKSWFVRETGVMVGVPELWGSFFVGRTKEGFSLNKVMNGYSGWTMERQMALDVIPILADGIKWLGYLPKQRILWNAGIYADWISKGQSFSTYKWQTAARVAWLPIFSPERKTVLHLGVNYRYGQPTGGKIRVRSRPEANPAPRFIDTEEFPTNESTHVGVEGYFSSGPLMIGSEIYQHRFKSVEVNDPEFVGGDVVISYMITGESRPYYTATGIYGFVPVKRSIFEGGPGAWEVLCRYSSLDLNGGSVKGGKFWRITPMVNWYASKDIRLELAYGYGILNRFALEGATHFFQARIQLSLL